MTNYEWPLNMSGEERQAWFDAPHADCEQVDSGANIKSDTRTLIIADVNAWIESNVGFSIWASDLREHVIGWLDRQAAITERHWMEIVGASANCNLELTNQNADLQAKVNSLVAENGDLEWRCLHFERKADELQAELDKWNELTKSIKLPDYPTFTQFVPKDMDADSREKLEADTEETWKALVRVARRGEQPKTRWVNSEFLKLLDRQAAITQAQIFKRLPKQQVSQESFESVIDDMSTEIELLTSERDNLAKDLADSVDQLSAERERFREVTSTILDVVHALERTANKYWNG